MTVQKGKKNSHKSQTIGISEKTWPLLAGVCTLMLHTDNKFLLNSMMFVEAKKDWSVSSSFNENLGISGNWEPT